MTIYILAQYYEQRYAINNNKMITWIIWNKKIRELSEPGREQKTSAWRHLTSTSANETSRFELTITLIKRSTGFSAKINDLLGGIEGLRGYRRSSRKLPLPSLSQEERNGRRIARSSFFAFFVMNVDLPLLIRSCLEFVRSRTGRYSNNYSEFDFKHCSPRWITISLEKKSF